VNGRMVLQMIVGFVKPCSEMAKCLLPWFLRLDLFMLSLHTPNRRADDVRAV